MISSALFAGMQLEWVFALTAAISLQHVIAPEVVNQPFSFWRSDRESCQHSASVSGATRVTDCFWATSDI